TDSQHAPQIIYDPILFDENGEAIIKDVSVNKVFITPRTQENSLIRYTLSMPSQVTIKFYNFETDVLVRTLTNNAARNAGINQESFNGKNDATTNLTKGVYYFIIEALTNTNQRGLYNPLHIPAPVQSINARLGPEHINPYLAETAQLTYDLQVPSWVTARIGRAGRATADRLLVNNQPRPSTNNIEIWDGRNDQGEIVPDAVYKSTIVATCLPVNAIVINEDPINLIEFVRATPYAMYPLYGETTTIDYKLLQPAKVTIEILNTNGTVLRTLLNNEQFSAGINNLIFNGKTDKQAVISTEGNYTIRVTADINGQKQIKEGYLKIFP
ncbi:MAG: hypothetical protein KC733_12005, partial [Candidatus Omnitrophica bacterium]|nr:hypothetical protein [Candidatus Omnitrophota bacterium]